jgi:hypothetical protein
VLGMLDARYIHAGNHPQLASEFEYCAQQHMTRGIAPLARALAARSRGVPFDQLSMGYRWGIDLMGSFDAIWRMATEVAKAEKAIIDDGLLRAVPESVATRTLQRLEKFNRG